MMRVQLYHGDCLDILPTLADGSVDAVVTDPPYGIGIRTSYAKCQRGSLVQCNDFKPIVGDDKPFDPTPFIGDATTVLFGANYYADKLPPEGRWYVWDKLDGLTSKRSIGFNDNSDCEFIWISKPGASRILRHRWMGAMKASEHNIRRVHPTQKPVALMTQIIKHITNPGDTILDPFMGSGTTGVACVQTGRNFIGIEIDAGYYAIAEKRIAEAQMQLSMLPGSEL